MIPDKENKKQVLPAKSSVELSSHNKNKILWFPNNTPLIPKKFSSKITKTLSLPVFDLVIGIDYLRIRNPSLPENQFDNLIGCITDFIGSKKCKVKTSKNTKWSASKKAIWYYNKIYSKSGIVGGFNINSDGTRDVMIDFSGKYFEQLE